MVSIKSKVIAVLPSDISTDIIYPGRFMATVLPTETPQYAFADMEDLNRKLKNKEIASNGIIVAGANFGCGSSREQAVSTLKGYDLIIVAKGFARIFLQNSINLGLKTVVCPKIEALQNDELEVFTDKVLNTSKRMEFLVEPLPKARQLIVETGGLIPYTKKRLIERYSLKN
jgi:3-isopropylmalate/(R)-2-methylmalate dehydratase small subunit